MTGEHLNHPYIARVKLTHGTAFPVREHWEEVVQELAVVGIVSPGPEREEVIEPLSSTTRFLCHLEEDFLPSHFDSIDSDGDHLHIFTQPNPDHRPCPQIGQPRILAYPYHTSLSSPWEERPLQQHLHPRPTGSRFITQPTTPPGCKPRKVVGTWPTPGTSSIKAIWWQGAYFGKIQKAERGTGAGESSIKEEDS